MTAVVLLAGWPVCPASGSVPSQLLLDSGPARLRIDTSPLRLTFENARTGATVLQEVGGGAPPQPGAQLFPVLGGAQAAGNGPTPYQPLAFEVGGQTSAQLVGPPQGNQAAGAQGGVVFSAQSVTAAQGIPGGYRLTVATSDPTRTMTVEVTRDPGPGLRVGASLSDPTNVSAFSDAFTSSPGEAFYGFGGRHNGVDQAGNNLYGWAEEEAIECTPAQAVCALTPGGGGQAYELGGGLNQTYYPQNQFVSSQGYGFLSAEPQLTRWHLASDNPAAWQVDVAGPELDYTVVVGQGPAAVRGLTAITGSQVRPAAWAEEATISRAIQLGMSQDLYRQNILGDLTHLERDRVDGQRLPVSDYVYEGWHWFADSPDFLRAVNGRLAADGIHPVGYGRAFVYVDHYFDDQQTYSQAYDNNYVADDATGHPYRAEGVFGYPSLQIDFTNPAARAWWAGRVTGMLDLGFDGFMQDFGEQVTSDMHFADGETGRIQLVVATPNVEELRCLGETPPWIVPLQQGRVPGDVRMLDAGSIGSDSGRRSLEGHQASTPR